MARHIYQETQYMRKSIFAYIFGAVFVLFGAGMGVLLMTEEANRQEIILAVGIGTAVLFLVGWLLFALKLEVKVEESRLSYRMPPLINRERFIQRDEITSYEVAEYEPVRQYGGWGKRFSPKHGQALTISGTTGLILHLTSGKKLLLGTRNKEGISRAMKRMTDNEEYYG